MDACVAINSRKVFIYKTYFDFLILGLRSINCLCAVIATTKAKQLCHLPTGLAIKSGKQYVVLFKYKFSKGVLS